MGMTEADTRAKLIDPALHARGWTEDLIKREETAGAIEIVAGTARKRGRGRADYTLRFRVTLDSQPVALALIEAKAEDLAPGHGMEQVKIYAAGKRLNVPFVFASNGHLFVGHSRFTGITTAPQPLSAFPTPLDLRAQYEAGMGFHLDDRAARPLLTRYTGGEATRRYYQDAAIRAVLEMLAAGKTRALLSLATGAGKTFIAVNLLKRIADAGGLRRALFVCDRDELRSQGAAAFQGVFGNNVAVVTARDPEINARVLIATYQTLDVSSDETSASFLITHYAPNYFSHIIIDECHRSAWGKWSEVLTRNPDAVQIGLTATPRELIVSPSQQAAFLDDDQITADNIKHFGPPIYEYDMAQGIEDGYLAGCEIIKSDVNLDDTGITIADILARHPTDARTGQALTGAQLQEIYDRTQYEDRILLPDRVLAMTEDLFAHLLATGGPEQKTIIFCARDRHADDVATAMNNLYAAWCAEHGKTRADPYAFKCTAASGGAEYIADLRGSTRRHFIATTVDLLTTGVDVPNIRNIVFFRYINAPMTFYQMVGRGTRLDPISGKLMFRVYDYTDASRLFGKEFRTAFTPPPAPKEADEDDERPARPLTPIVQVEGFEVHVTEAGRYIVTEVKGKAMPVTLEQYKERLTAKLVEGAPTVEAFRGQWVDPQQRQALLDSLPDGPRSASLVRVLEELQACDLYDVLADLGYGLAPHTRANRAESFLYKHKEWLVSMPVATAATLSALAAQFAYGGTDGLENPQVFQAPAVMRAGGRTALEAYGSPAALLRDTKERMFAT